MIAIYRASQCRERRSASVSGCQSLRMCTKDMGNTPFLSGSPSMCPIWKGKGERERVRERNIMQHLVLGITAQDLEILVMKREKNVDLPTTPGPLLL